MMIKANGEYLDFDDDIEIESRVKLFDEIDTTKGDFSYTFEIPTTNKNLKALGFPYPDSVKSIYQDIPSEVIDESGIVVYYGTLQVNRLSSVIEATFYSGNSDWFGLLDVPMTSLPLYKYDVNLTSSNIQASWNKTSGMVFPIVDAGALITRSFNNLMAEDFVPFFYVKTLFYEIFNQHGIKLTGDLLKDSTFDSMVIGSNPNNKLDSLEDRSCYVKKTLTQAVSVGNNDKVLFQDETTFPFFDGSNNNFSSSTYTADIKMRVQLNFVLNLELRDNTVVNIRVMVGGSTYRNYASSNLGGFVATLYLDFSKSLDIILEAGETLEIYFETLVGSTFAGRVLFGSTIKITPNFSYGIYKITGTSAVPNWTQAEFVSSVLKILNVIPSYEPISKTLTLDLFNNIAGKEPVDISDSVEINGTDFTEFVSNYAKQNYLSYGESNDEDLKEYNISNFVSYGSGVIESENDFLTDRTDIVDLDFTAPITYLNPIFDMSMERFNFLELEEIDSKDITSVSNSSGIPRFNVSNADNLLQVGDLVRIDTGADSDYEYNGEWVVNAVTSSYFTVNGLFYGTSADGTVTLLRHKYTTDDNVYLLLNVPIQSNLFFSSNATMYIDESDSFTSAQIAFFNLLSNGRQINTKYKQSLSFGTVNNPLSYQKTIIDTYWGQFRKILNDPVMLLGNGYFKMPLFQTLKTFLRPVRIRTNETNNLYYLNRTTGYKSGHEPCEIELIKL